MPRTGLTAEQIREKAIDATLTKMRKVGFEKVRLSDIAKELGVSHAALYSHFKDKSELLDAVSDRWLLSLDEDLDAITQKKKDPCDKIQAWALMLHQAKAEKVRRDPELYRSFDTAAHELKPFVKRHLENLNRQLLEMVKEAIAKKGLRNADPLIFTSIIRQATTAFHHPRLVAQNIEQKRENLLHEVIETVLKGLRLKS